MVTDELDQDGIIHSTRAELAFEINWLKHVFKDDYIGISYGR